MQVLVFISFLLIYLGANAYVCLRIVQLLPAGSVLLRIIVISAIVICTLGMFLFFIWGEKMPIPLASFFYTLGVSWLIAFLYLLIAFLLIDIVKLINLPFHFIDKEIVYRLTRANWKTLLAVLGSVTFLLVYANYNYHNIKRVYLTIETGKWNKTDKSLRIVAISDAHLGYTTSTRELRKWVELINAEKPDIVLIAGDLIDNSMRPINHFQLDAELRKINALIGVFACTGNHEYIADSTKKITFFKQSNITLLRDSVAVFDNFQIIGRDDYSRKHRKSIEQLTENLDTSRFTILLDHQPMNFDDAIRGNVDFQFSGHTHRGQVFPITMIADRIFELSHGYLKRDGTHFYTSSGLGIWGGKFRVGTQSEYVVIDISPLNPPQGDL
jgi:predicted MPP superfamily phosphohydrolase